MVGNTVFDNLLIRWPSGVPDESDAGERAAHNVVVPNQVPAVHHGGAGALCEWPPLLPPCVHRTGQGRCGCGCLLYRSAAWRPAAALPQVLLRVVFLALFITERVLWVGGHPVDPPASTS